MNLSSIIMCRGWKPHNKLNEAQPRPIGTYFTTFGNPILFNTSFAFANFSGNRIFPLYFSKDLSMTTIGVFRLFNSPSAFKGYLV
jgi:hypothetical protein